MVVADDSLLPFYYYFLVYSPWIVLSNAFIFLSLLKMYSQEKNAEARVTHFVVLQLCCSDFCSGFVTMVAVYYGQGDYSELGDVGCVVDAFWLAVFGSQSILLVLLLGVVRYRCLTQRELSFKRVAQISAFAWILSYVYALIPTLSGGMELQPSKLYCYHAMGHDSWVSILASVSSFLICIVPSPCLLVFYFRAFRNIQRLEGQADMGRKKFTPKVAGLGLAVVCTYFLTILPWAGIMLYRLIIERADVSPVTDVTGACFIFLSYGINPILYVVFVARIRNSLWSILTCRKEIGAGSTTRKDSKSSTMDMDTTYTFTKPHLSGFGFTSSDALVISSDTQRSSSLATSGYVDAKGDVDTNGGSGKNDVDLNVGGKNDVELCELSAYSDDSHGTVGASSLPGADLCAKDLDSAHDADTHAEDAHADPAVQDLEVVIESTPDVDTLAEDVHANSSGAVDASSLPRADLCAKGLEDSGDAQDTEVVVVVDSISDAVADSMPDAVADLVPDAGSHAEDTQAVVDSVPEIVVNSMPETVVDSMPDAVVESIPDTVVDPMSDAASHFVPDADTHAEVTPADPAAQDLGIEVVIDSLPGADVGKNEADADPVVPVVESAQYDDRGSHVHDQPDTRSSDDEELATSQHLLPKESMEVEAGLAAAKPDVSQAPHGDSDTEGTRADKTTLDVSSATEEEDASAELLAGNGAALEIPDEFHAAPAAPELKVADLKDRIVEV